MLFSSKKISIPALLLILLMLASGQTKNGSLWAAQHSVISVERQEPIQSPVTFAASCDQIDKADYMTQTEREVVREINLLRSDPPGYAHERIEPLRIDYHGKLLFHPERNPIPIETSEGVAALDECIRVLENTKPLPLLTPSEGLALSSRDLAQDQGSTKNTGHTGNDGSTMSSRIERYGEWDTAISENISYGFNKAQYIIAALLIDDGVQSRGHRVTLLNNLLNFVGVSVGPHRRYQSMCVMDFAAEFTTKKP
jgi:hypothetical protein